MFLFTHKLCTLFQTLKIRCYDRMTIYPLCTAADFTLCPLFRGGAVVKGWKWFALLPIKIKRCHCQFATDQTRTSSQSLVRRGEEGLQEMERKYVCLFIYILPKPIFSRPESLPSLFTKFSLGIVRIAARTQLAVWCSAFALPQMCPASSCAALDLQLCFGGGKVEENTGKTHPRESMC